LNEDEFLYLKYYAKYKEAFQAWKKTGMKTRVLPPAIASYLEAEEVCCVSAIILGREYVGDPIWHEMDWKQQVWTAAHQLFRAGLNFRHIHFEDGEIEKIRFEDGFTGTGQANAFLAEIPSTLRTAISYCKENSISVGEEQLDQWAEMLDTFEVAMMNAALEDQEVN
jgi:hypothetical protein